MFSKRVPLGDLITFCRAVRHSLGAGLPLTKVFRQQAAKGPRTIRPIAGNIADDLEQGESLETALEKERFSFPPLFVALSQVGEETGNLPEILAELERYLVLIQKLRNQFWAQISWPLIQAVAAVFVIAGMIFILGILSPAGGKPFDPLGFGLTGSAGALSWLGFCFGSIALGFAGYLVLTLVLQQQGLVDEFLLRLPIIGPCLQALAMMRFCLALGLTMETGMSITTAMRLSLRATGNAAYEARGPRIHASLKDGEDLSESLAHAGLFPEEFLNILSVGEEGGRIHNVLKHQAEYYEEEASRRMKTMTSAASYAVWGLVACLIIFLIFRIFSSYIAMLDQFSI